MTPRTAAAESPARQLSTFIGRFSPPIQKIVREARTQRQPGAVHPPRRGRPARSARDRDLIGAAIGEVDTPLPKSGRGRVVIRSAMQKRRPRRR
jgi:hypothetical protein